MSELWQESNNAYTPSGTIFKSWKHLPDADFSVSIYYSMERDKIEIYFTSSAVSVQRFETGEVEKPIQVSLPLLQCMRCGIAHDATNKTNRHPFL
jgi:hypothetical protein